MGGAEWAFLDQVSHVHGHLLHRGVVEALDVAKRAFVVLGHHVDGHPFSAETTTSANPEGGDMGGGNHYRTVHENIIFTTRNT